MDYAPTQRSLLMRQLMIHTGKLSHSCGKSPFFCSIIAQSTISTGPLSSSQTLKIPEGNRVTGQPGGTPKNQAPDLPRFYGERNGCLALFGATKHGEVLGIIRLNIEKL